MSISVDCRVGPGSLGTPAEMRVYHIITFPLQILIFSLIKRKKFQNYNGASWNTVGKNKKSYSIKKNSKEQCISRGNLKNSQGYRNPACRLKAN